MSEEGLRRGIARAMASGRPFLAGTMQSAGARPVLIVATHRPPATVERLDRAVEASRPGTRRWARVHEAALGRMRVSPAGRGDASQ